MPVFTPQLNFITQFNPGINLSDADMKLAAAGQLQLDGLGSILPTGPIVANPGSDPNRNPAKGCTQILRYQKNSNDLMPPSSTPWLIRATGATRLNLDRGRKSSDHKVLPKSVESLF